MIFIPFRFTLLAIGLSLALGCATKVMPTNLQEHWIDNAIFLIDSDVSPNEYKVVRSRMVRIYHELPDTSSCYLLVGNKKLDGYKFEDGTTYYMADTLAQVRLVIENDTMLIPHYRNYLLIWVYVSTLEESGSLSQEEIRGNKGAGTKYVVRLSYGLPRSNFNSRGELIEKVD